MIKTFYVYFDDEEDADLIKELEQLASSVDFLTLEEATVKLVVGTMPSGVVPMIPSLTSIIFYNIGRLVHSLTRRE